MKKSHFYKNCFNDREIVKLGQIIVLLKQRQHNSPQGSPLRRHVKYSKRTNTANTKKNTAIKVCLIAVFTFLLQLISALLSCICRHILTVSLVVVWNDEALERLLLPFIICLQFGCCSETCLAAIFQACQTHLL